MLYTLEISVIVNLRIPAEEGGRPLVFHQIIKGEMSVEILIIVVANVAVKELIILTTYHRGGKVIYFKGSRFKDFTVEAFPTWSVMRPNY
jgi:hypothetical protein